MQETAVVFTIFCIFDDTSRVTMTETDK